MYLCSDKNSSSTFGHTSFEVDPGVFWGPSLEEYVIKEKNHGYM